MKKTDKAQPRQEQGREKSKVQPEKTKQSDEKIAESNIRDITERREIEKGPEKALKELDVINQSEDSAREYAESIIDTVREPLIVLDQDLRVVSVSRSFYDVFRVNPKETVGQLIYDLGNKQWDIPKLRELLETILPQKTTFDNYEVEHNFATIGRRIMLLNARQIQRVWGKERIILLAIEDITERKELEGHIRDRTAQLEAANKGLETFSYSVSHDLRAPLRALDGFSAALLANYPDQLDEQGRHYLDRIRDASQRMGQLIEDLLGLSRVTRSELVRQRVDLSALAQEVAAELRKRDPQRQAEFVIAEKMVVEADPHLLRIVLQNLLDNAWKFTGPRSPAHIEVGMSKQAGEQVYFVRDNGVGFDMSYVDKLFTPFQRLHGQREFPGTGIGLATVQRIVARHAGRAWAEAQVDKGATFYFTLGGT